MDVGEQLHQAARDAKADLEAAVEAFEGVEGLGAAKRRIGELTEAWKTAEREAERHGHTEQAQAAMRRMDDWDRLTLAGRRAIIRATIDRIVVEPVGGRGLSRSKWNERRVDVQFVGEGSSGFVVEDALDLGEHVVGQRHGGASRVGCVGSPTWPLVGSSAFASPPWL